MEHLHNKTKIYMLKKPKYPSDFKDYASNDRN